ncbi:hypothetical protein PHYPO_G00182530 [Pangasianodon hypophthalmus]|uniref:Uncharacterized protein n=1 Tax=Pangasianodon hypophthalmus TaxID=310915 RepID=A0A5N5PS71_PANHP|nr:hypothetical protein PHYPO_G00182530 [Pangasianodon hypophthalmus]
MKLSSTAAKLTELNTEACHQLYPDFSSDLYEYSNRINSQICSSLPCSTEVKGVWLSKTARMDSKAGVSVKECSHHRACPSEISGCLVFESRQLGTQVARGSSAAFTGEEQHLQTALALKPSHSGLRFGFAAAGWNSVEKEKGTTLFLQQGLEYVTGQFFNSHGQDCREQKPDPGYSLSIVNAQFLRGGLSLGALLSKHTTLGQMMSPMLVYQNVAAMAVQALSVCVGQGHVTQQLGCPLCFT